MNTIKLLGVRDIKTDQQIESNIDYGLVFIASRISKEIPDTFEEGESKDDLIYKLKVINLEAVYDLKTRTPLEVEHGQTKSQKLRWRVEQSLGKDEYDLFMDYLMGRIDELTDDYLDKFKVSG